ncbi:MAG: DUF6090 family protein [Gelidibacter sp.]
MIKFFRNVRQRTLGENRFSKYLLYAIGEIVLVIIGILIALWINQMVQDRKNIELRNVYIHQLTDEVDRNIGQLTGLQSQKNDMMKEVDTLMQYILNEDFDNPKLGHKSGILIQDSRFQPLVVTYENLKSSGDFKLFNDLKLRNAISTAYETFNEIKMVEYIDEKAMNIYYENFLMPRVNLFKMSTSSKMYAKDIFFHNMILSRKTTLQQENKAYQASIDALKELKTTLSEIVNHD